MVSTYFEEVDTYAGLQDRSGSQPDTRATARRPMPVRQGRQARAGSPRSGTRGVVGGNRARAWPERQLVAQVGWCAGSQGAASTSADCAANPVAAGQGRVARERSLGE